MQKRQSHPELHILLAIGIPPRILIEKGYSKATVYKYSRAIEESRKKIIEMLRK
jgi:hypothetical protein